MHEKIAVDGPVGALRQPLEHYAYRSLDDQLAKLDRYARLMATQMHAAGRRAGLAQVLLHPAWRLLRGLFIKLGHSRRLAWLAVSHRGGRLRATQVPAPVGAVARRAQ